jgi:hypothetical protein
MINPILQIHLLLLNRDAEHRTILFPLRDSVRDALRRARMIDLRIQRRDGIRRLAHSELRGE